MQIRVGTDLVHFDIRGERVRGSGEAMVRADDDLTAATPWADEGFLVAPLFAGADGARLWQALVGGITLRIAQLLNQQGLALPAGWTLDRYHQAVAQHPPAHQATAKAIQEGFPADSLPAELAVLIDRVSELCGVAVDPQCPYWDRRIFNVRLVRPGKSGANPLHRDVWLDHLRDAVNVYIPLAGSTAKSSLCLVPGSHRWPESCLVRTAEGATVDGASYSVPAVVEADRRLNAVRPNPGPNEVLLFSPYLVHGGVANLEPDLTRVSVEMRFWRKAGPRRASAEPGA